VGCLCPWDVIGGCRGAGPSNIALQGGDQVGQVTVTWIPVEHESGSVLDDQMIDHG